MAASAEIPSLMKAIHLTKYGNNLEIIEKPVPKPQPGEVLVKMALSPINPSDQAFLMGNYGFQKELPVVPGFEGSGIVAASGGGVYGRFLVGRRVACNSGKMDGAWAEYMTTSNFSCIPLRKEISLEQGAMSMINPLTAMALIDIARKNKHTAVVQSAAAGALGRMIWRYGKQQGIQVINIVRRPDQVALLKEIGAEYVFDSSQSNFLEELKQTCRHLEVRLGFDSVSGDITGQMLNSMPTGGRVIVYGALSLQANQVHPGDLVFRHGRIEGFWQSRWMRQQNIFKILRVASKSQKFLGTELKSEVHQIFNLEQANEALETYQQNMTKGKILLRMSNL